MGFYKRWVTKEGLISNIDDVDSYLSSDALIFDDWSHNFYVDLDPSERLIRERIKSDIKIKSGCPDKHENYKDLKSLSESFISLMNDPSWLDIHFVKTKLNIITSLDETGDFEKQKRRCLDAIIDYYERS